MSKIISTLKGKWEDTELRSPNRALYITAHNNFSKKVKVYDLTPHLTATYPSEDFKTQAKELLKSDTLSTCLTITNRRLLSRFYDITVPASQQSDVQNPSSSEADDSANAGKSNEVMVAEWKAPLFSAGSTTISFPPDSPHCQHLLKVKPCGFFGEVESFVLNSVEYRWKSDHDGKWTHTKLKLTKVVAGQQSAVAKYWEPMHWNKGGIVIFNDEEIDWVVVVLTCCVTSMKEDAHV